MKQMKSAIVGCGNIYPVHAEALKNMKKTKLEYMIDIKKERAKKAAQKYNCSYLTDYKKLLKKNIDVVHICTPHHLHRPMAVDFLKAGINVLVEKPMALNYNEAKKIIAVENKSSANLGVCFQNRFNENNQKAKKILQKKTLGEIKGIKAIVSWHRGKDYYLKDEWRGKYETEGGGVLINQAIHTLDLVQWFGGKVESLKANVDTRVLEKIIDVEDTVDATLFFDNQAVAIFYATNTFSSNSPIEIVIDCEKGSLRLFDDQLIIKKGEQIKAFQEENDTNYKKYWGYGHKKLIKAFYQDLRNKSSDNTISAQEGIKTLELIKFINKSAQKDKKYYLNGGN